MIDADAFRTVGPGADSCNAQNRPPERPGSHTPPAAIGSPEKRQGSHMRRRDAVKLLAPTQEAASLTGTALASAREGTQLVRPQSGGCAGVCTVGNAVAECLPRRSRHLDHSSVRRVNLTR
jgi:hypothetical protein